MWKECSFTKEEAELFGPMIPGYCKKGLENGELKGVVFLDPDNEEKPLVGIVLYRIRFEMIEIEWVMPAKAYNDPETGVEMVFLLTNHARLEGGFRGVRARFREKDRMSEFFPEEDFAWRYAPGNVFRFQIKEAGAIVEQAEDAKIPNCVPLEIADEGMKKELLDLAEAQDDPVPLLESVRWESYDREVSAFYRDEGKILGGVLVEKENESLVFRLLFAENPVASISLLVHAFQTAFRKYGGEMEVLCPVLNESSETLVRKILGDSGQSGQILAEVLFSSGNGTSEDYDLYTFKVGEEVFHE